MLKFIFFATALSVSPPVPTEGPWPECSHTDKAVKKECVLHEHGTVYLYGDDGKYFAVFGK
jgi:hypothetical protein